MFIVLLRFSTGKDRASSLMGGHQAWIDKGFRDGVFLLVGSLKPGAGGTVLAHGVSRADLDRRVQEDPFVEHGVVTAEVLDVAASKADERLRFLLT